MNLSLIFSKTMQGMTAACVIVKCSTRGAIFCEQVD